jgi:hypothetical protein
LGVPRGCGDVSVSCRPCVSVRLLVLSGSVWILASSSLGAWLVYGMDLDWIMSWCRYGFGDSVLSLDPSIFCLVSVGVDMDGVLLGLRLWCRYWVDLLGYRVLNGWMFFLVPFFLCSGNGSRMVVRIGSWMFFALSGLRLRYGYVSLVSS